MSWPECQNNPIYLNFHLQKSLETFEKNSADKIWSNKDIGVKMPCPMQDRVNWVATIPYWEAIWFVIKKITFWQGKIYNDKAWCKNTPLNPFPLSICTLQFSSSKYQVWWTPFLSISNLNFTGSRQKNPVLTRKKNSSSSSIFQTEELQKSRADRQGDCVVDHATGLVLLSSKNHLLTVQPFGQVWPHYFLVQVNSYEIIVNFFHINQLFINLPEFTQFVQLTKQFM